MFWVELVCLVYGQDAVLRGLFLSWKVEKWKSGKCGNSPAPHKVAIVTMTMVARALAEIALLLFLNLALEVSHSCANPACSPAASGMLQAHVCSKEERALIKKNLWITAITSNVLCVSE
jgi:hypothetical protein